MPGIILTSREGPIAFDQSGEIVQNVYLQHAVKVNGKMEMQLVETMPMVKAPRDPVTPIDAAGGIGPRPRLFPIR